MRTNTIYSVLTQSALNLTEEALEDKEAEVKLTEEYATGSNKQVSVVKKSDMDRYVSPLGEYTCRVVA